MADSLEKFCLGWDDFENNVVNSYTNFGKKPDFSDVTLVILSKKVNLYTKYTDILSNNVIFHCKAFSNQSYKGVSLNERKRKTDLR